MYKSSLFLIFVLYFPKQNLANISSIISSVAISPVMLPKSSKISFIKIATISEVIPSSKDFIALFTLSIAFDI